MKKKQSKRRIIKKRRNPSNDIIETLDVLRDRLKDKTLRLSEEAESALRRHLVRMNSIVLGGKYGISIDDELI